jgi:hypothetical protein
MQKILLPFINPHKWMDDIQDAPSQIGQTLGVCSAGHLKQEVFCKN